MLSHFLNAEVFNNILKGPRNLFPTREYKNQAYFDLALPLICKQTISQPCIVELITQVLKLGKVGLPCAEFYLSKFNCLTKNKNEALSAKIIPVVRFVPMTSAVPK